jgi:DNA-binding CsgD family transcriptional regulator
MLAEADFLYAASDRLTARSYRTNQALIDILAAAENGDGAIGVRGIALPLTARDGGSFVAHVLPLTSGARRRAGCTYAADAAIFVRKAVLELPSPPETIARHYRLTPTELRVLLAIVEVGGVPEVAEALGVADTTVKTHLGNLYGKTGGRRQADLVKLVAGFASPLVN